TVVEATLAMRDVSGLTPKWLSSVRPARPIGTVTLSRARPRIRLTASGSCMSLVTSPSIFTIRSPVFRPARYAGVPSIGDTTVRMSSLRVISMPSPPKEPDVSTCISLGVGIQERAVRVEAAQRALDRAVDQLLGRHLIDVLVL